MNRAGTNTLILIYRRDGLGQRVMAILRAMLVSKWTGYDFAFIWRPTRLAGGLKVDPARDLLPDVPFYVPKAKRYRKVPDHMELIEAATQHYLEQYTNVRRVVWLGPRSFNEVAAELSEDRRGVFRGRRFDASGLELRLASPVQDRVDEVMARHDLKRSIGVHVRRGDVESNALDPKHPAYSKDLRRYVPVTRYFDFLDEHFGPEVGPIFLCTDGPDVVVPMFQERYGEANILFLPTVDNPRETRSGMQGALAEMVLLSKCRFIACGTSAFPSVGISLSNVDSVFLSPTG